MPPPPSSAAPKCDTSTAMNRPRAVATTVPSGAVQVAVTQSLRPSRCSSVPRSAYGVPTSTGRRYSTARCRVTPGTRATYSR